MKQEPNDELSDLLQSWQPRPIAAAQIRSEVWRRIQKEEAEAFSPWFNTVASWFERPSIAAAVVALAIGVGIAFGSTASTQAQTEAYLKTMVAFRH